MRFAVLMTCHNRVATTLECLRRLFAARLPEDAVFDVWLNDDGSTDGTGEKCREFFADCSASGWRGEAHIVQGSGNDYWCGGMRRAWAAASAHADYDGYLWLNDDTFLNEGAFGELLVSDEALVVGAVCASDGIAGTYGGYDADGRFVERNGRLQEVERANGNAVWVPRRVFERIGNFDTHWTHAIGDGDYSLLVREAGMKVLLTAGFVGMCECNDRMADWVNPAVPFLRRLRSLYSPLGYAEPPLWFRYCRRQYGLLVALKRVILQHVRVCFPSLRKKNGSRSFV